MVKYWRFLLGRPEPWEGKLPFHGCLLIAFILWLAAGFLVAFWWYHG